MQHRPTVSYFSWSITLSIAALLLGGLVGWSKTGSLNGALSTFTICLLLACLELSLSFDNAVVNATKLRDMDPIWRRRFLTWGIIIAVFGMRIVFPIAIVVVAAGVGPLEAIRVAVADPEQYARLVESAHLGIAAFGGTFLMMVALEYFLDHEKDIHWIPMIERPAARGATIRGLEIGLGVALLLLFASLFDDAQRADFIVAGIYGLLTFLGVRVIAEVLDARMASQTIRTGGLGAFLYLEMLDASFSFDGVIGAFALSKDIFVIAIGLGIGALFVRSMTILFTEREVISKYRFLEHGAFYAVLALALIMFLQPVFHIPELLTGLVGVTIIGSSLGCSLLWSRKPQNLT